MVVIKGVWPINPVMGLEHLETYDGLAAERAVGTGDALFVQQVANDTR